MKHSLIISLSIAILLSCSGGHQPSDEIKDDGELSQMDRYDLKTYVLDGCEYIGRLDYWRTDVLTHKGNCKYCEQRNKENLAAAHDELWLWYIDSFYFRKPLGSVKIEPGDFISVQNDSTIRYGK